MAFGFGQPGGLSMGDVLAYLQAHAPPLPATHAAVQATSAPFQQLGQDLASYYRSTTGQATQPLPSLASFVPQVGQILGQDAQLGGSALGAALAPVNGLQAGTSEAWRQFLQSFRQPTQPKTEALRGPTSSGL